MLKELAALHNWRTSGDEEVVRALESLSSMAWAEVARRGERWRQATRYAGLDHYESAEKHLVVWPETTRLIRDTVAGLTKPFSINVFPYPQSASVGLPLDEVSQSLSHMLRGWWATSRWDEVVNQIAENMLVYGVAYGVVGFDPRSQTPLFLSQRPQRIWPDPEALDMEEAEYIVRVRAYPYSEMVARWPDIDVRPTSPERRRQSRLQIVSPADADSTGDPIGWFSSGATEMAPVTWRDILEVWVRLPQGASTFEWRVFTWYRKQLLEVRHERRMRLVHFKGFSPEDSWYGLGLADQLKSLQRFIDATATQIWSVARKTGHPKKLVPTSAVDTEPIRTQDEDEVAYPDSAIQLVRYLEPPSMPPYIPQIMDMALAAMDRIAGFGPAAGIESRQTRTAAETAAIQERAGQMIRHDARLFASALADALEVLLATAIEAADGPALMGPSAQPGLKTAVAVPLQALRTGPVSEEIDGELYAVYEALGWAVTVDASSAMSIPRSRIEQLAMLLYDRGILDAEGVISLLDVPGAAEALERIRRSVEERSKATDVSVARATQELEGDANAVLQGTDSAEPELESW